MSLKPVDLDEDDAVALHYKNGAKDRLWEKNGLPVLRPDTKPRELGDIAADAIEVEVRKRLAEQSSR